MANSRHSRSTNSTDSSFYNPVLPEFENSLLASQCIQRVAQQLDEFKYFSPNRSFQKPFKSLDEEIIVPIIEPIMSPLMSNSSVCSVTIDKLITSPILNESFDYLGNDEKTLKLVEVLKETLRKSYNLAFKRVQSLLYEESRIKLIKMQAHKNHIFKNITRLELTPSEKRLIKLEAVRRFICNMKINQDQKAI